MVLFDLDSPGGFQAHENRDEQNQRQTFNRQHSLEEANGRDEEWEAVKSGQRRAV